MKGYAQTTASSKGYAILFAVLMVSIILAITLGVLNVALKELNFTTTARNSHISFFAADTAGECALFGVLKKSMLDGISVTNPPSMQCDNLATITSTGTALAPGITRFDFIPIPVENGCAYVDITVDNSLNQVTKTTINAHGYNLSCTALTSNPNNKVERLLSYEFVTLAGTTPGGNGGTTTTTTGGGSGGAIGGTLVPIGVTGGSGGLGSTGTLQAIPTGGGQ